MLNNVTFLPTRKDNIQSVNGQIGLMKKNCIIYNVDDTVRY